MDKMIVVDVDKCLGCHSCELNCAVAHTKSKNLQEAVTGNEKSHARIILDRDGRTTIPIHCRHCEDAPCIASCPTSALWRSSSEDPVVLSAEKCIGCNACIIACPFGVIKKAPEGKVCTKCDLCFERLQKGQVPACVEGCMTRAIKFLPIKDVAASKREKYRAIITKGRE